MNEQETKIEIINGEHYEVTKRKIDFEAMREDRRSRIEHLRQVIADAQGEIAKIKVELSTTLRKAGDKEII